MFSPFGLEVGCPEPIPASAPRQYAYRLSTRGEVPRIVVQAVRIKFCGITRMEDALEAARLGAWAIGLNHHAESPRLCDPAMAAAIGQALRRRLEVVGVFVNALLDNLTRVVEDKALRVRSAAEVRAAEAYRTDFHLLDAYYPEAHGGTGESFDWELVAARRS